MARAVWFACLALTGSAAGSNATPVFDAAGLRVGVCAYVGTNAMDRGIGQVSDRRVVAHVLSPDESVTTALRGALHDAGVYGIVSVETRPDLSKLPYATRLLNLVVVEDLRAAAARGLSLAEALRVAVPGGSVLIGGTTPDEVKSLLARGQLSGAARDIAETGGWVRLVAARPAWMGEWTHGLKHDAGMRGLAEDRFDPAGPGLNHMWIQWLDAQHRPPDHGSMTSHISLNGRYISLSNAETPVLIRDGFYWRAMCGRPGQYVLSARDAFNGMLQWTRPWKGSGCAGTRGGREATSRLLAGMGDFIYTVEQTKPSIIDPVTGQIIRGETELTATDAGDGSIRFVVSLPQGGEANADLFCDAGVVVVHDRDAAVYAFDAVTGAKKWEHAGPARQVAADRGRLFVGIAGGDAPPGASPGARERGLARIEAVSAESGRVAWIRSAADFGCESGALTLSSAGGGRVLCMADESRVIVVKGDDGTIEHNLDAAAIAPVAACGVGDYIVARGSGGMLFFDARTGKQVLDTKAEPRRVGGYACSRGALTEEMFLALLPLPEGGVVPSSKVHEFVGNQGVNISCYVGPVFANGLMYQPQQYCGCGEGGKTTGLLATGTITPVPPREAFLDPGPLERGPAYGRAGGAAATAGDWPAYRANAQRSCSAGCDFPAAPKVLWMRPLAHKPDSPVVAASWRGQHFHNLTISAPVVAMGKVFVSLVDEHAVVALDAATGDPLWRFTANGRIDSPPTVHDGLCMFGSRDGWVYALDAADGAPVWRRRVTPVDERIMVYGQLESRFPAIGSVLVEDGRGYATAGLSGQMGIMLWEFEPRTGKSLAYRQLERPYGGLNDVLLKGDDGGFFINRRFVGRLGGPVAAEPAGAPAADRPRGPAASQGPARPWRAERGTTADHLRSGHSGILNTIRTLSPVYTGRGQMDLRGMTAWTWAWTAERVFGFGLMKVQKPLVDGVPGSGDRQDDIKAPGLFGLEVGGSRTSEGLALLWQADVTPVWAMAAARDRLLAAGPDPAMLADLVPSPVRTPPPRRTTFQEMMRGAAPAVNMNSAPRASVPIEQFPPSRDPLWEAKRIHGLWEPQKRDPLCVQGLFYVVNAADGTVTSRIPLPATAVQDGIAIAGGRAYAALADGSVACLGE